MDAHSVLRPHTPGLQSLGHGPGAVRQFAT